MSDSLQPHELLPTRLLCPWDYPDKNTGVGSLFPSPGDLPKPGIEPRSPTLHADSFPAEPPGKPKNTGVGSLSLLQGIFLTQESNWGLLHCRWILYRLSHQGRPRIREWVACPFSRDLPDPGIELGSPALQADSLPAELPGKPMGPGATKRIRTPQLPPGIQGGGRGRSLK